ncbi:hypothetical protein [Streptomyces sp. NPDC003697]
MTARTVPLFAVSAGLVAMGCVKADRVGAWRESVDPSDPDIPDSASVVARVTLFAVAAVAALTSASSPWPSPTARSGATTN